MNLLKKAREIESRIASKLAGAARDVAGAGTREPLEVTLAMVDAVDRHIQPGGRGSRVFPFNRIVASVLAGSHDDRARLEAILSGPPSLKDRIVERLRSARCADAAISVEISYVARAQKNWRDPQFDLAFSRVAATSRDVVALVVDPTRIDIALLKGVGERRTYSFTADRIDLGRGAEVRDRRNRILRTNQVALVERSDEVVNQSVSRQHAHISHDAGSGGFRLHDDGSEHGTGIVRGGRTVPVPRGSRGVRLQSGDEIVLGEARLRVKFESRGINAEKAID
jgi:hypothetical protein